MWGVSAGFFLFLAQPPAACTGPHQAKRSGAQCLGEMHESLKKVSEKQHTEHERDVKNDVFDRGASVYFHVYRVIFGIFRVFLSL